jgi:hypothetical protein
MTDGSSFSKLAALYSRVTPSNGGGSSSLSLTLDRVAVAERNLDEARTAARAAAKREGVSLANLFGETQFIARSSGERWRDEAAARSHAEGKQEAYCELTKIVCNVNGVDYEDAMAQARISIEVVKERSKREQARLRSSGFYAAVEAGDLERAGRIHNELFPVEAQSDRRSADLARQILTAAARRDSDPSNERKSPEGLARSIVNAGRRRRGEKEID